MQYSLVLNICAKFRNFIAVGFVLLYLCLKIKILVFNKKQFIKLVFAVQKNICISSKPNN